MSNSVDGIQISRAKDVLGGLGIGAIIIVIFLAAAPKTSGPPMVTSVSAVTTTQTAAVTKWTVPIYDVNSFCQDTEASDAKAAAENPELQQLANNLSGGESKTPERRRYLTNHCIEHEQESYNKLKQEPADEVTACLAKIGQPREGFYALTAECIDMTRKSKAAAANPPPAPKTSTFKP